MNFLLKGAKDLAIGKPTLPGKIAFGVVILISIILIIIGFSIFQTNKVNAVWCLSAGAVFGGFALWNLLRKKKWLLGGDEMDLIGEQGVDGGTCGSCGETDATGGCGCDGGSDMNELFDQMGPDLWDEANE